MTGSDRLIAVLRQQLSTSVSEKTVCYPLSLTEPLALGRDPRCQVVLDPLVYRTVSRFHAEISLVPGLVPEVASPPQNCWQICDRDSANGTFVNGQRVHGCQVLQVGDRIVLGREGPEFVFEYLPSSIVAPSSPPPAARSGDRPGSQPAIRPAESPAVPPGVSRPGRPVPPERPLAPPSQPNPGLFNPGQSGNLPPNPPSRSISQPRSQPSRPSRPGQRPVSLTQLFPILSTGRELTRKAYLLPGGITVSFVVLLFLAVGNALMFNLLLAAYIAGAAYYFIYQLCGKHKPWWVLVAVGLSTALLLLTPVLDLFVFVFRTVLPGDIPLTDTAIGFFPLLIKMFFGAGLMEELLKALPVFAVWWLGYRLKYPQRSQVGVWEPLDGILLGAASAVGFTLIETLGQYIPEIYKATLQAGEGAAQLASLQLLIPRVLGSVAGHLAYSGYFGYFIGLSGLRVPQRESNFSPRQRCLVLSVGYLTAASLHALWNTSGVLSPVLLAVVGVVSYAFLTAAILKARALSPTRSQNFATRFYK